ncbi:S-adenosyl-L-methionine-dependent methyltransferase [Amylostereum chailletii]|nr:S-adenosyl-L-methionine-dependent methyltransferase [Amylostereum chailletii]
MSTSELEPSRLGTKTHWDNVYEQEVANFEENGDEGEVWFGEDSVEKMTDWALDNVPPNTDPYILEIGSGNGTLLFSLQEAGYTASRLRGVDYSADAVKLATMISQARECPDVSFSECDFLSEAPTLLEGQTGRWDLLLDKGTYDAIALGEKDAQGRSPAAAYPSRVTPLLKPGGFFLITSCNFTEEELKQSFANPQAGLVYHSRVQHRAISFGGQSGSVYATIAFQKPV